MSRIAIIPARGGSSRVPLKNIRNFHGIPMLSRTISILKDSDCFDQIIVSTDNYEIKRIAEASGAIVPFMRSETLSKNEIPTVDVIADAIINLGFDDSYDICCAYATNPFLRVDALKLGQSLLNSKCEFNYITTVTSFPFPIQRALMQNNRGFLEMAQPEYMMSNSQDLPIRYHECAQFWWAKASTWKAKKGMQTNMIGILLPTWMVQDIDTLEDWESAELKFEVINNSDRYSSYKVDESNILTINLI